jgi:hypothetical protein
VAATYRSRFHFDYFPNNLQRFQEIYDESSDDNRQDHGHSTSSDSSSELLARDVEWILGVLGVVLPCRMDPALDVKEHNRLREAHESKLRVLKNAWQNEPAQELIASRVEYSVRLADVFLDNLLGRRDELTKPLPEDAQEEFEEAGFTIWLSVWYMRLGQLFKGLLRDCALFKAIYSRHFLGQLALLLHSPDGRERRAIYHILSHVVERNAEEYASLSRTDEKRQAQDAIKAVLGIIQSGFYDLSLSDDEITLRPILELLAILYESLIFVEDTEFKQSFQTVLLKGTIPLFDNPGYYCFSDGYESLLKRELGRAKEMSSQQFWELASAALVGNIFKRSKGYSENNDNQRIRFLLSMYRNGLISPSQHVLLFFKLFKQVRENSRRKLQQEFLELTSEPRFLRNFRSNSAYYPSDTLRYRVIREFSKAIFEWFLAGSRHERVQTELSDLASAWLETPAYKNISQTDAGYESLGKRVREKLLEDLDTQFGDLGLSGDDELSDEITSSTSSNSTVQHFEGSDQDNPTDLGKFNSTIQIGSVAVQDAQ